MPYSSTKVKPYALTSFLLAMVECLITGMLLLGIAADACERSRLIETYHPLFSQILCHSSLASMIQSFHSAPVLTLWLTIVLPISSIILAVYSLLRFAPSPWKLLAISALLIHFLLLLVLVIEVRSKILLPLSLIFLLDRYTYYN